MLGQEKKSIECCSNKNSREKEIFQKGNNATDYNSQKQHLKAKRRKGVFSGKTLRLGGGVKVFMC